ncbi:uncharacterized protein LOC126092416 [Schistocerca cancellata]|uniref:uncharacterized protein LOC126092416 n=1 Tax=Schistocerca cancellata TaxID=274614 RepID=UPI0021196B6E|nr:uncharacterized protein LOC126092416 [Schistocerca cancellata]
MELVGKAIDVVKDSGYVLKQELPTYIKVFGLEESVGLFVHGFEVKSSPDVLQDNSSECGLDITGSPLKCSFAVDEESKPLHTCENWLGEEADYCPLAQQEARLLLRKYTKNYCKDHVDCPELWVLTKGNPVLHAVELVQGWWSRTLVTQCGSKYLIDVDISSLVNKHTSIARMPDVKPKCHVVATCDVNTNMNSIHENSENTNVTVKLKWNQPVKKPPHDTTAVINITCDAGSNANRLWQHLMLLHDWVKSLKSIRVSGGHDVELPGSGSVIDRLNDFEFMNTPSRGSAPTNVSDAVTDNSSVPLDGTDKLWLILSDCSNQIELKQCFSIFFGCVLSKKINPYVRPTNCTTAARIIKELISGERETVPELLGNECVEIIIEMGMEKLVNEYLHIFLSTNLLTPKQMKQGLIFSGRISDVDNCMTWLAKRHAALELLVVAERWLLLDRDYLSTLAVDAVVFCDSTVHSLEDLLIKPTIKMHTAVNMALVLQSLNSEFLHFGLSLTSENKCLKVKSMFVFTKSPIFPEKVSYKEDTLDLSSDCESYNCYELLRISDKVF